MQLLTGEQKPKYNAFTDLDCNGQGFPPKKLFREVADDEDTPPNIGSRRDAQCYQIGIVELFTRMGRFLSAISRKVTAINTDLAKAPDAQQFFKVDAGKIVFTEAGKPLWQDDVSSIASSRGGFESSIIVLDQLHTAVKSTSTYRPGQASVAGANAYVTITYDASSLWGLSNSYKRLEVTGYLYPFVYEYATREEVAYNNVGAHVGADIQKPQGQITAQIGADTFVIPQDVTSGETTDSMASRWAAQFVKIKKLPIKIGTVTSTLEQVAKDSFGAAYKETDDFSDPASDNAVALDNAAGGQCGIVKSNIVGIPAKISDVVGNGLCGGVITLIQVTYSFVKEAGGFFAAATGMTDADASALTSGSKLATLVPKFASGDLQYQLTGDTPFADTIRMINSRMLDLINIFLVIFLILIALANILQLQVNTYQLKKIVPGLVLGFILANLSYFIMRALIEISRIATTSIIASLDPKTTASATTTLVTTFQKLLPASDNVYTVPGANLTFDWSKLSFDFFITILVLVSATYLICVGFLFLIRFIVFLVLIPFAPIAFLGMNFPLAAVAWKRWWKTTQGWLFMPVISSALIAFAVIFIRSSQDYVTKTASGGAAGGLGGAATLFNFAIGIFFLHMALTQPFKMAGEFKGVMDKWGQLGSTIGMTGLNAVGIGGLYRSVRKAGKLADTAGTNAKKNFHDGAVRQDIGAQWLAPLAAGTIAKGKKKSEDLEKKRKTARFKETEGIRKTMESFDQASQARIDRKVVANDGHIAGLVSSGASATFIDSETKRLAGELDALKIAEQSRLDAVAGRLDKEFVGDSQGFKNAYADEDKYKEYQDRLPKSGLQRAGIATKKFGGKTVNMVESAVTREPALMEAIFSVVEKNQKANLAHINRFEKEGAGMADQFLATSPLAFGYRAKEGLVAAEEERAGIWAGVLKDVLKANQANVQEMHTLYEKAMDSQQRAQLTAASAEADKTRWYWNSRAQNNPSVLQNAGAAQAISKATEKMKDKALGEYNFKQVNSHSLTLSVISNVKGGNRSTAIVDVRKALADVDSGKLAANRPYLQGLMSKLNSGASVDDIQKYADTAGGHMPNVESGKEKVKSDLKEYDARVAQRAKDIDEQGTHFTELGKHFKSILSGKVRDLSFANSTDADAARSLLKKELMSPNPGYYGDSASSLKSMVDREIAAGISDPKAAAAARRLSSLLDVMGAALTNTDAQKARNAWFKANKSPWDDLGMGETAASKNK